MDLTFYKMHGAGNDFILVDDRSVTFPADQREWLASIASRRTGVGCEGVILIQPSNRADFRMRFYNPDGGEVEMCGNGARCVARLAHDLGVAPASMNFDTVAGLIHADVHGEEVELQMTEPGDWRTGLTLDIDGVAWSCDFVNTGVPHVVVRVEDVSAVEVERVGRAIRRHAHFAPAGTNVNFAQVTGPSSLRVRTYERGVEQETGACGTGIVASALLLGKAGAVTPPVEVTAASGDTITVSYELTDDGARQVRMRGPAVYVFRGSLSMPGAA